MTKAVDVTVTGRVQGVSFRAYAEQQAQRLGVTGWVRNEPDGTVSAHLEGAADAVDRMVDWCRSGPPAARVRDVAVRGSRDRGFGVRAAPLNLPAAASAATLPGWPYP